MNGLLTLLGIESWKPVMTALVMPPLPFFLLMLIGARLILPRRGLGWFVILLSMAGLWLSACAGMGGPCCRVGIRWCWPAISASW